MKLKTIFFTLTLVVVACVFLAGGIQAGTKAAEVIPMDNPAYEKHTKGIVQFSHKKHAKEYDTTCGECHHDDKGQPLDLKDGDDVQSCIACHKIPSQVPKDVKKKWKADKVKKADKNKMKLDYHAEALHVNCIVCHKAWNKKNKSKAAPTSCTKCHPKTK